jgi:hypothetical protein
MEVVTLQTIKPCTIILMGYYIWTLLHLSCFKQLQGIYCLPHNTNLLLTTNLLKAVTSITNFEILYYVCKTNIICYAKFSLIKWHHETHKTSQILNIWGSQQIIWCLCTTALSVAFSFFNRLLHRKCKKHCTSSYSSDRTADCCERSLNNETVFRYISLK